MRLDVERRVVRLPVATVFEAVRGSTLNSSHCCEGGGWRLSADFNELRQWQAADVMVVDKERTRLGICIIALDDVTELTKLFSFVTIISVTAYLIGLEKKCNRSL